MPNIRCAYSLARDEPRGSVTGKLMPNPMLDNVGQSCTAYSLRAFGPIIRANVSARNQCVIVQNRTPLHGS